MPWQVIPPGGWHYPIEGIPKPLEAESHDALVKTLHDYRVNNALPIGEPERDVDAFICTSFPNLCGGNVSRTLDADAPPTAYGVRVERKMSERVASWIANRFGRIGEVKYVDAEEAQRRANICLGCHANNTRWKQDMIKDCPPCQERLQTMEANIFKLKGGKSVQREGKLGACQIAGHENSAAAWLQESSLRHRINYELPDFCWMNHLAGAPENQTSNSGQIGLATP